jgi:hypothetical protein
MHTNIHINGLSIEYKGGDNVLLLSEAPTEIAIDDLISELLALRPQRQEVGKSRLPSLQVPCNLHEGSNQTKQHKNTKK